MKSFDGNPCFYKTTKILGNDKIFETDNLKHLLDCKSNKACSIAI